MSLNTTLKQLNRFVDANSDKVLRAHWPSMETPGPFQIETYWLAVIAMKALEALEKHCHDEEVNLELFED